MSLLIIPISLNFTQETTQALKSPSYTIRDIQAIDWENCFENLSDANSFYTNLSPIIDKHVPLRLLSRKEMKFKSKPWITQGLKTSIKIKKRLYKTFIRTRSTYHHHKFKTYRNKTKSLNFQKQKILLYQVFQFKYP